MKIHCRDIDQFLACVAGLAQRGLGFNADADRLTIELTGAN